MVVDPVAYMRVSMLKYLNLLLLIALLAQVNDPIAVRVALVQIISHSLSIVPIHQLDCVTRWVAHGDNPGCDVGHVEIKSILLQSLFLSRDHGSKHIFHYLLNVVFKIIK